MSNSNSSAVLSPAVAEPTHVCNRCGSAVELIPTRIHGLGVSIVARCSDRACDKFHGFFPTHVEAVAYLMESPKADAKEPYDRATDHCWTCGAELLPVGFTHLGGEVVPVFPYDCASCNAAYVAKLDAIGSEDPRQLVASGRRDRTSDAWEALKAEPAQMDMSSETSSGRRS
jgi:hypothetical protein